MSDQRITLLDGLLALGVYHDLSRHVTDQDAIKLDFLEDREHEGQHIFRCDHVRIGISLPEAKALMSQLEAAIEECEFVRRPTRKGRRKSEQKDGEGR